MRAFLNECCNYTRERAGGEKVKGRAQFISPKNFIFILVRLRLHQQKCNENLLN